MLLPINGVSKCQYQWFVYLLDLDLLCFLFFVAFLGAPLKFFSCKLEVKQLLLSQKSRKRFDHVSKSYMIPLIICPIQA